MDGKLHGWADTPECRPTTPACWPGRERKVGGGGWREQSGKMGLNVDCEAQKKDGSAGAL